jgi:limonene-1,2-epoxide hydrolase
MTDPKYKAFTALDPFFDIVQQGLAGQVDGGHFFDTIADNAVFEYDNRFISVVTIEDRKIVQWRDYMDSLTAMTALSQTQ